MRRENSPGRDQNIVTLDVLRFFEEGMRVTYLW